MTEFAIDGMGERTAANRLSDLGSDPVEIEYVTTGEAG